MMGDRTNQRQGFGVVGSIRISEEIVESFTWKNQKSFGSWSQILCTSEGNCWWRTIMTLSMDYDAIDKYGKLRNHNETILRLRLWSELPKSKTADQRLHMPKLVYDKQICGSTANLSFCGQTWSPIIIEITRYLSNSIFKIKQDYVTILSVSEFKGPEPSLLDQEDLIPHFLSSFCLRHGHIFKYSGLLLNNETPTENAFRLNPAQERPPVMAVSILMRPRQVVRKVVIRKLPVF